MEFQELDAFFKRLDEAKEIIEKYKEIDILMDRIFLLENFLKRFGSLEHLVRHLRALEHHIYLQKEYLTVEETADYISQSVSYVYGMTSKNEIPLHKPGGKVIFIKLKDINAWIERSRLMSQDEIQRNGMKRVIEMRAERDDIIKSHKARIDKKQKEKKEDEK